MILALYVENTNIEMGCFEGKETYFTSRIATDRKKTADEYAISFKNILEMKHVSLPRVHGAIVASVVPAMINVIKDAVCLLLGTEPMVVGPGVKTGLNILMDNPGAVGSDFVVSSVAAMAEYPVPLIVVNFGTATTFHAVSEKKSFIGSVIAPGTALSSTALAGACDQLPRITIEAPGSVIGKNTVDSMKSGAVLGTAAMVDGMIARMEKHLGKQCTVVATGSLASAVVSYCETDITVDELLLLKGLRLIYEKNIKK